MQKPCAQRPSFLPREEESAPSAEGLAWRAERRHPPTPFLKIDISRKWRVSPCRRRQGRLPHRRMLGNQGRSARAFSSAIHRQMSRITSLLLLPGDAHPAWRRPDSSHSGQHGRTLHPAVHPDISRQSFPTVSRSRAPVLTSARRDAAELCTSRALSGHHHASKIENPKPHEIPRLPRRRQ